MRAKRAESAATPAQVVLSLSLCEYPMAVNSPPLTPGSLAAVLLLLLWVGAAVAEIEIVSGPGPDSPLVCNDSWIAWENNTAPFYDHFVAFYDYEVEINDTLQNVTFYYEYIQVLEGSMPEIPIVYFEEGENGTRGRPVICFDPPKPRDDPPEDDGTALVAVIYTTSSLAILASILALVTYALLPTLQTLPGLVMMNLFLSFLLGEIMLQVRIGLEYNGLFSIISLTIHQGFLVSRFIWMSIAGFEMCRSLYRGIRMRGRSSAYHKWGNLALYMLLGWGTSLVLTIVMLVVEMKGGRKVKEMIGVFGYLTNHVPIALTQLTNIIAVIFITAVVIAAARRQRRVREYKYSKQNVNFVRLFLVLLSVLGLVWLLFFVLVSVPEVDIHRQGVIIFYVIVTDTQPVFVCIAFVCTPKVFKMCLVRLKLRKPESPRRGKRTGTIFSSYNSSTDLERRTTKTLMLSFKNLSPTESVLPTLQAITEEDEEKENDSGSVENGNVSNGRANGAPPGDAPLNQINGTSAAVERREHNSNGLTEARNPLSGAESPNSQNSSYSETQETRITF